MEFETEDREGVDEQHEQTLRRVAYGITAITTMATLFVFPSALVWALGPRLAPAYATWVISGSAFVAMWLTPYIMFPAATRVLLGQREPLYESRGWKKTLPSTLWLIAWMAALVSVGPRLRAWGGSSAELPLYAAFMLPFVLPPLWQRWRSGRAIWPAAQPFVFMALGMLLLFAFVFWMGSHLQTQGQNLFWVLAFDTLLLLLLMPVIVIGSFFASHLLNARRVLLPAAAGEFASSADRALDIPDMGPGLAAALWMEQGDFERMQELLDELEEPTPMAMHLEAVLLDEQGQTNEAWERMAATWAEHKQPLDVMVAAQGLVAGANVLPLLDEMDAQHSDLDVWIATNLLQLDHRPGYAACRAWALAAQGREEAARDALPAITDLPPLLATERDYLYGRALHALGDPEWRSFLERAAAGVGRTARLSRRFLDQQDSSGPALVRSHPGG